MRVTLNRRDAMVGLGRVGLGALTLPGLLGAEKAAASALLPPRAGRARSCVLVFLWGGPPQQDMFDMKPDAPEGIRSHFKPIPTSVPGLAFGELMPRMAKTAHRQTLIRTVTHGSDTHEPSVYHMLTGRVDPQMVIPRNNRQRSHHPGPSGVLSCLRPSTGAPSAVTLPRPIMHDGIKYAGTHAGWLGAQYDPLELPDTGFDRVPAPNPEPKGHQAVRPVWEMNLPGGVEAARLARRRGLLGVLEEQDRRLQNDPATRAMGAVTQRAFELLASPEARRAFRLSDEKESVRDRYGRNHYGESFLLARRLIESGVRLVTLNWMFFRPDGNPLNPWDNHGGTPALGGLTGYDMLRSDYCIPPLDLAHSALIEDLDARGLLDETLVVTMGEFGRTPKINATQGRDHWGACQSVLLAGGGVRRGFVCGTSDAHAAYPAEDPVSPEDLLATMYLAMGLPPETEIRDVEGRPHPISTGRPIMEVFG